MANSQSQNISVWGVNTQIIGSRLIHEPQIVSSGLFSSRDIYSDLSVSFLCTMWIHGEQSGSSHTQHAKNVIVLTSMFGCWFIRATLCVCSVFEMISRLISSQEIPQALVILNMRRGGEIPVWCQLPTFRHHLRSERRFLTIYSIRSKFWEFVKLDRSIINVQ